MVCRFRYIKGKFIYVGMKLRSSLDFIEVNLLMGRLGFECSNFNRLLSFLCAKANYYIESSKQWFRFLR